MHHKANNFGHLNIGVLIALILGGYALYFIPLQSKEFYFDDHFSIENNEVIKKIDIPKIFNTFNTRFLVGLSFALNYTWCGLHPSGYRLINLLIHCLNAFLVYLLIKSTLYLCIERKLIPIIRLEWPALFASMLFLCHPIQTEPVNFITQRFVLMGTFFYLLTLFLYIQHRCRKQKKYLLASLVAAMAAMFCKEFVVTLPFMLALYDFYFLSALADPWWKRCSRILPFFAIALIVPILLLRTPTEAIGVANIADSKLQENDSLKSGSHIDITRARGGISRRQYFLTELNVMCTYVRLLFLPVKQNFDYDYPLSGARAKDFLSGFFLLCLLALAAVTFKSYRIVSFSILWFFIALSVESSFIPIGHVIAEYRLYLASVGFAFLVTAMLYVRPIDHKKVTGTISKKWHLFPVLILIVFSILTYQRNQVWRDELTLWNDTVDKSPHKARPYYNRGHTYDDQGDLIGALSDYTKAIGLNPNYTEAYDNRGIIYGKKGNLNQAISDFNKTIDIDPKDAKAYFNRGDAYYNQRKLLQALSDYTKAIEINPKYAESYNNRGNAYDDQGNQAQALADYTKAIEINPEFAEAYDNRGIDYCNGGNLPQSIADFTRAIEIDPKFAEAYNNRGYANYKEKAYDKAWADVNKAKALGYVPNPGFIRSLKAASGRNN